MPVLYQNNFDGLNPLAITQLPDGRDEIDINLSCGGIVEVVDGQLKCTVYPTSQDCILHPAERPRAQLVWLGGRYYHPTELYISHKMFIPESYRLTPGGWDYIYDFHFLVPGVAWLNLPKLFIKQRDRGLVTFIPYEEFGGPFDSDQTIPKNKWIQWIMRYKLGVTDGIWQVWQDDKLIWDLQNINNVFNDATEISSASIKTYTSMNEPDGLHKLMDDFIVSTEPITPPTPSIIPIIVGAIGTGLISAWLGSL